MKLGGDDDPVWVRYPARGSRRPMRHWCCMCPSQSMVSGLALIALVNYPFVVWMN